MSTYAAVVSSNLATATPAIPLATPTVTPSPTIASLIPDGAGNLDDRYLTVHVAHLTAATTTAAATYDLKTASPLTGFGAWKSEVVVVSKSPRGLPAVLVEGIPGPNNRGNYRVDLCIVPGAGTAPALADIRNRPGSITLTGGGGLGGPYSGGSSSSQQLGPIAASREAQWLELPPGCSPSLKNNPYTALLWQVYYRIEVQGSVSLNLHIGAHYAGFGKGYGSYT
jgi:hypothetical protein